MVFNFLKRRSLGEKAEMSFVDHLEVLRGHLFRSAIAVAIGAAIVGVYNKFFVHKIIMGPTYADFPTYKIMCKVGHMIKMEEYMCMQGIGVKMQNTAVAGQFSMFFNVILIGGFIIAFPYIFWEFWRFIKPALNKKELDKTRGVIFWVSMLFFTGVLFGYFLLAPYTINFFSHFTLDENIENRWTIASYMDTLIPLILGTGLAFQLPLVMFFLAKVDIVSASFLKKVRKYAVVVIFIIAAIITPGPDIISQISVALPLMILYEASIILCRKVEKQKAKDELEEWS